MAGFNKSKLVSFLKKNGEAGQSAAAKHLGVSIGQLPMIEFCRAQVEAGVYKEIPSTTKSVTDARDKQGNRWELIAARAGVGVAEVKKLYDGDASKSYTGRGRNHGSASTGKAAPAKKGGAKPSGKAAGRKPGKGTAGPQRARTRAQRMARAGDPS